MMPWPFKPEIAVGVLDGESCGGGEESRKAW